MMRTLAQTGNGWMTFKDAVATAPATRPREPGARRAPVEPVHRDPRGHRRRRDRGVQPRLDQPRPRTSTRRRRSTSTKLARDGAHRGAPCLDRVIDINYYPIAAGRSARTRAGARSGSGVMGLQDVFFQLRLPFDSPEARALSTRIAEEIYFHALRRRPSWPSEHGRAPGVRRDPRRARRAAVRPVGRRRRPTRRAGTRCAQRIARDRAAQLAADRDRADRDDRLDRRLLRVHRAAGVQPVQARDAVGRVPPGQPLPRRRAEGARPVDRRRRATRIKLAEGSVQGIARAARATCAQLYRTAWELPMRSLIDMAADRGAVHRPEPVAEPVPGEPDHRQALLDVPATRGSRA